MVKTLDEITAEEKITEDRKGIPLCRWKYYIEIGESASGICKKCIRCRGYSRNCRFYNEMDC